MKCFYKIKKLLFIGIALFFSYQIQALPETSLTKSCKPIVDPSKVIAKAPIRGYDERTSKRLMKAQELQAEEKYNEAIIIYKEMIESAKNDFILSIVNTNLAYAYAQKGDQIGSLPFFKEALKYAVDNLPHDRVQNLRMNIAYLMYGVEDKSGALKMMETWMDESNVHESNAYALLAALYSENKQYDKGVCSAYFAVKYEPVPKKAYYQAMLVPHWELQNIKGVSIILKEMVEFFPEEDDLWRNLSTVYYQLEQVDDAVAIMDMFYLRGKFNSDKDYRFLSTLFAYKEAPYRSAKILEEGINKGVVKSDNKMWQAVANNYHISNELNKAIVAFGKSADLSDDGDDYYKQGSLYIDIEDWSNALIAIKKALNKGGLDDIGKVYLRKGIAEINLKQCDSAISTFALASKYKDQRNQSEQWSNYAIDRKKANKC